MLGMKNLRKRRDAAGLSRYELAKQAGVSPETIEAIEMRGTATSVSNAVKLAAALDTTVEDLMGKRTA
jgi:DNA-binding XRE family transcriptional regulator